MSVYKELNDREWLLREYVTNLRSCLNISKEIGCNNNAVRQALIKHKITVRNPSEAQLTNSTTKLKIDKSVLDGSLMGDAFLSKWRKNDKSLPHLKKKNKNIDHLEWFAKSFEDNPSIVKVDHYLKKTDKVYTFYEYRTKVDEQLQEYYNRWYPASNNYKKVIPEDIIIDEMFLLQWFLDDGYSHSRNRDNEYKDKNWKQRKKQICVRFCTECFTLDDHLHLCNKINKKFKLDISPKMFLWSNSNGDKLGYRAIIPQSKADRFFNIIGRCPIKSLEYKWK